MRILLAENDRDLLSLLNQGLSEKGYEVIPTNSGADALLLLETKPPPDLVVLDLGMPGIDGYEILSRLGPSAPPIIIITGSVVEPTSDLTKVNRILEKPFTLAQLTEAIEGVLNPPIATPSVTTEPLHDICS